MRLGAQASRLSAQALILPYQFVNIIENAATAFHQFRNIFGLLISDLEPRKVGLDFIENEAKISDPVVGQ